MFIRCRHHNAISNIFLRIFSYIIRNVGILFYKRYTDIRYPNSNSEFIFYGINRTYIPTQFG